MANYTIHCLGFDAQQQASIEAIMDLATSALKSAWKIIEHSSSDVLMINLDAENNEKLLLEQQKIADYRIVYVAEDSEKNTGKRWFLTKKKQGPPSLKELVELLNQVDICLQKASEPEQEAIENTQTEGAQKNDEQIEENSAPLPPETVAEKVDQSDIFEPQSNNISNTRKLTEKNFLFGVLLTAGKDKKHRIIELSNLPPLYLSPIDGNYFFAGKNSELKQLCSAAPRLLRHKIISKSKFEKLLGQNPPPEKAKSFPTLICYAILIASQGRLLDGHSANQPIKLSKIPDTDQFPLLKKYQSVAELMAQQESSLFTISEQLQQPLTHIFNYYNVCYLLGYISQKMEKSKTTKETKNSHTLGHFLSSFFKKSK